MKTGVFIHVKVNGDQVLDLDEPGFIQSGMLSIGSRLDGSQIMPGEIFDITVREGVKEVRALKIFQSIFWLVLVLGSANLLLYHPAVEASISRILSLFPVDKVCNFLWQFGIIIIVLEFSYYVWFFSRHAYFPAPFVYAKSETFTDYFATLYWAHREGRYDIWGTVYPPLIFLFLKSLTSNTYINDVHALRVVAYQHIYWLIGVYLLAPVLVLKTRLWNEIGLKQKLLIYLGIIFSIPMLFALERGNFIYITPVFIALILSYPGIVRKISFAVLVNLKPYFFIFSIGYLLKGQWRNFTTALIYGGGLFLVSGMIIDHHFYLFFQNLFWFSGNQDLFTGREVIGFPSSISAWPYYLRSYDWAQLQRDNGVFWTFNPLFIQSIDWIKRAILFWAIVMTVWRYRTISLNEWFLFTVAVISNSGTSVSGYSMLLYYPFIPVMLKMRLGSLLLGLLVLMMMPWDQIEIVSHTMANILVTFKFGFQNVDWILGAGSIIRPVLNLILLCIISFSFKLEYMPLKIRHQNH
jgi:hypothetical protein